MALNNFCVFRGSRNIFFCHIIPGALGLPLVFPGGSEVQASACNMGDLCSIPGSGRSSEKAMATHSVLLPGKSHGPRSLVGYSPWGPKEFNTTEWLHFHFSGTLSVSFVASLLLASLRLLFELFKTCFLRFLFFATVFCTYSLHLLSPSVLYISSALHLLSAFITHWISWLNSRIHRWYHISFFNSVFFCSALWNWGLWEHSHSSHGLGSQICHFKDKIK